MLDWFENLSASKELADLGFRFLAGQKIATRQQPELRIADIGGSDAAPYYGISLIHRKTEPNLLYARFAEDYGDMVEAIVKRPDSPLSFPPLVELPLPPTASALASLHARYVAPGRSLPPIGPFVSAGITGPEDRIACHHEHHRRLRVPLGVIPADDPDNPEETIDDVVEIERGLIFNRFLTTYQWTLHSGNYTTDDGEPFTTPYTTMETIYSRSLISLDCRYSPAGCHMTLEVDYPPEEDTETVRTLLDSLSDHWPDNDLLTDDLPFDVIGAIAGLGIQLQPEHRLRDWIEEGDASTLISLYYVVANDDANTPQEAGERVRALLSPFSRSPHEEIRYIVKLLAEHHDLLDLAAATEA